MRPNTLKFDSTYQDKNDEIDAGEFIQYNATPRAIIRDVAINTLRHNFTLRVWKPYC